jgi:hypothetical protein
MPVTFLDGGIEPVEIELEITAHHVYKHKPGKAKGCAVCNAAKTHADHLGAPPSMNVLGSGNRFAYQAMKKAWQEVLTGALERVELPRGLSHVLVEGQCTFPDRDVRDQGNHRFMLEKAMGDALVAGGWLPDDAWEFYEFGGLAAVYEKGVSRTRLMVFGS